MARQQENNVVSKTFTTSHDNKFNLVGAPMWFHWLNVHCLTHPAYYGDRVIQEAPIYVNDVVFSEHPVNLQELFFKNQGSGNNSKIVAVGALMLKSEMRRLGIPVNGI